MVDIDDDLLYTVYFHRNTGLDIFFFIFAPVTVTRSGQFLNCDNDHHPKFEDACRCFKRRASTSSRIKTGSVPNIRTIKSKWISILFE